jgi:hypothetical protein
MGSTISIAESNAGTIQDSFWAGKDAENLRGLLFVLFYVILANAPFWAADRWLGLLPVGWFCLEYAGVGLLALFLPRKIAAALLLVVISADLLSGVSRTYYLSPTECLANFFSLHQLPGARLLGMAAIVCLMLAVGAIAAFFPGRPIRGTSRQFAAASLIAFVVVVAAADWLIVSCNTGRTLNPLRPASLVDGFRRSEREGLKVSRYPIVRLVRSEIAYLEIRNTVRASSADSLPMRRASDVALRAAGVLGGKGSAQAPNVVLILLESWGNDSDPAIRRALTEPYQQPGLLAGYRVIQGTVPFNGSTINGEGRELCGSTIGFHLMVAGAQELQGCLPDRLAAAGYHSIAVHGMDGNMFDRSSWYRTIGFQQTWFRDRFRKAGLPDCEGTFTGTCDAEIAEWIGRGLEKKDPNPEFVYWVTLNSHLPVPIPSALPAAASCSASPALTQSPALCAWYQLVHNVHEAITRLAMGNLSRPTAFVIVGDHAPPFSHPDLRSQFSSTDVPFVVLAPREESQPVPILQARPAQGAGKAALVAGN